MRNTNAVCFVFKYARKVPKKIGFTRKALITLQPYRLRESRASRGHRF